MNLFDLLALAYIAYSAARGRKRGLIAEAPGAVSVVVFFFGGLGLLKLIYKGLAYSSQLVGQSAGVLTFIGLLVATLILWRKVRARIRLRAERWCPEAKRNLAGAIAGGVKAFLLAAIALSILAHGPFRGVVTGSLLGRGLIRFILPAHEQAR